MLTIARILTAWCATPTPTPSDMCEMVHDRQVRYERMASKQPDNLARPCGWGERIARRVRRNRLQIWISASRTRRALFSSTQGATTIAAASGRAAGDGG